MMTQQIDDILLHLGEVRQHLAQGMTNAAGQTLEKVLPQLALIYKQLSATADLKTNIGSAKALAGERSSLWQRLMDAKAEMEQSLRETTDSPHPGGVGSMSRQGTMPPGQPPVESPAVSGPSPKEAAPQPGSEDEHETFELRLTRARAEVKGVPWDQAEIEAKPSARMATMKERHAAECRVLGDQLAAERAVAERAVSEKELLGQRLAEERSAFESQLASSMAEIQRLTDEKTSLERCMTEEMKVLEQRLHRAKAALERRLACDRTDESPPAETIPQSTIDFGTKYGGVWKRLRTILRRRT